MGKRVIQLIEAHIEKGLLALAALFVLYLAWGYLFGSPNRVRFGGRELGPTEVYRVVRSEAEALERAMRNATPEPVQVESFADRLQRLHAGGVFAVRSGEAPPLEPELRMATTFGKPIEVPGLEEFEQPPDSVEIVTPLPPTDLVVTSGHSMAYRTPLIIGPEEESTEPADKEKSEPEPQEVTWVTVAGYFNKKAQFQEMEKAGYAGFRSRAYIAGLDVERQELLASGKWSGWKLISQTTAMPKVEVPEPVFDDEEGTLINKQELDEAFTLVKQEQVRIMQPPFYVVDDGDEWMLPPLKGLEQRTAEEQEETEQVARESERVSDEGLRPSGRPGLRPPGSGRGLRPGAGRGLRPAGEPGLRPGRGVGPRGMQPGGASPRGDKAERRRWIRQQLLEARKALAQKDYNTARQIAEDLLREDVITPGMRRDAEKILKLADRRLQREQSRQSLVVDRRLIPVEPIRHPETRADAVWFHDDTVEPGKTYRYRMRVRLWNRYVGQLKPVKNDDLARQAVIVGAWSLPTRPVTVPPNTYFFVRGAVPGSDSASVEVWKWRKGRWVKELFDVRVGDVIGGKKRIKTDEFDADLQPVYADVDFSTGAVVLDLRPDARIMQRIPGKQGFTYREQESLVLVYLDPADGRVKEKAALLDRYDPVRKRLEESAF